MSEKVYSEVFAPYGVEKRDVIKGGKVLEDVFQLVIPIIDESLELSDRQYWLCPVCGEMKYDFVHKDDSWDYMSAIYFRFGMIAAVSQKVKIILEDLNVSQDEYVLKPISVEGSDRQIYLLFIKKISDAELIYPESSFKVYPPERMMHFSSYNERAMVPDGCGVRDIFLPESYRNRDIINLQSSVPVFFSQRLVDAFEKNNIKGFAVVKNCKSTLNFI